jgi:hypothetical protein
MLEIKFDAHIVDGRIEISEEQLKQLTSIQNVSSVEVIVYTQELTNQEKPVQRDILKEMEERGYDSIIDYLMDYPLQIEGFEPLTRDEIYTGKRFS